MTDSANSLREAMSGLILSASGWRKVFAHDGDEESRSTALKPADEILVAAMALAFGRTLTRDGVVAVATDSRPTGPVMADIIIRVLLSLGLSVRYSGVTAIPELLAAVQLDDSVAGFAYVSASHNPIGHNGLKLGYSDGAVAGGREAAHLISSFRSIVETEDPADLAVAADRAESSDVRGIYADENSWKRRTYEYYYGFTRTVTGGDADSGDEIFRLLKHACNAHPIGVVAELNGSARSTTIDRQVLQDVGIKVHTLNDVPGEIVHRIVPEGSSLDLCRTTLNEISGIDLDFSLGYVPDNDGDRGNLVYSDADGTAQILHAQQVFALSCLSELALLAHTRGKKGTTPALEDTVVVVNGPTSMRVERIAEAFGARVERAEVGEANVVGLARDLRASGKTVRFLGEGSNGGNITHPAACRDPLNTLFSIIKLILLRSESGVQGLFELWCHRSRQEHLYKPDFALCDILGSLPRFTTTNAYEDRAIMRISSTDQGRLKTKYEEAFAASWPAMQGYLGQEIDVVSWQTVNYEETKTSVGVGNRNLTGPQSGGLKILLQNRHAVPVAYLWMRGSGTEPVFRILVDVEGDRPQVEKRLLAWQRELIEIADA